MDVDVCASVTEDVEGKSTVAVEWIGGWYNNRPAWRAEIIRRRVEVPYKKCWMVLSSKKKDLVDLPDDPFRS